MSHTVQDLPKAHFWWRDEQSYLVGLGRLSREEKQVHAAALTVQKTGDLRPVEVASEMPRGLSGKGAGPKRGKYGIDWQYF